MFPENFQTIFGKGLKQRVITILTNTTGKKMPLSPEQQEVVEDKKSISGHVSKRVKSKPKQR